MHRHYWNRIADDYHKVSNVLDSHKEKYNFIADAVQQINPRTVLDIGCGSGLFARKLLDRGYHGTIVGLDFSEEMLKIANNRPWPTGKVEFRSHDLHDPLPFVNKSFEVCVIINVLFNVSDSIATILSEVNRVLNDGGVILVVEPDNEKGMLHLAKKNSAMLARKTGIYAILKNLGSIIRLLVAQRILDQRVAQNKEAYFSKAELIRQLIKAGFEIILVNELQAGTNYYLKARKK